MTNALHHATMLENNANGDMIKLTDARSKEYTQTWERAGSRRTLGWPDSAVEVSTYDANGNLVQWKSRGDFATVNAARNAAQEISALTWSSESGTESGNTSFTRNAGGQVSGTSATTMALSVNQSLAYDAEGRLATLGQTVGAVTRTAGITYNLEGRVSTLTYPSGFVVSYHYNKDGQIEAINKDSTTIASYGYDAGGRLATRTLSNGVVTSYAYDAVERMNSITVSKSSTVLWAERYGYNAAGERIHTLRGTTGTLGDAYWLDAASQLRGVKYNAADATGAYSGVNATTTTEWGYDAVGNRLEETSGAGTANYTVNTINQYTAITGVGTLAYSARGDLIQLGDWELTYDAQGNLLRAHNTATNALAQYWRDATGHRAVKDVDGSKTLFFNLGTAQLEAYDVTANATSSTIYEPGIDRPLAEVSDSGDVTFCHQDWLGSVVLITDALGTKVQTYTYDAWGQPSGFDAAGIGIPPASFVGRFLYTGREYDAETALYHYRARAYSPTLGRFLQPDPIDFDGGDRNLFRYVSNNPINAVDPLGLITIAIPGFGPQNWGSNANFLNRVGNMHPDTQPFGRHQRDQQRALDAIKDALAKDPCEKVNIYGYSRGGVGALELAEKLNQAGIPVDNLVLVDPVTVTGNGGGLNVPSNVRNAESHYQGSPRQGPLDFPGTPLNNPGPGRSNTPYPGPHQNMPGQFTR